MHNLISQHSPPAFCAPSLTENSPESSSFTSVPPSFSRKFLLKTTTKTALYVIKAMLALITIFGLLVDKIHPLRHTVLETSPW